jgi:ABC-type transporter Mla MlaB component
MSKISAFLKIDAEHVASDLQAAGARLDGAPVETILDFSAVLRIDPRALVAMEELIRIADDKAVKIWLRGVNVEIYKVLKLVKLVPRFSFLH